MAATPNHAVMLTATRATAMKRSNGIATPPKSPFPLPPNGFASMAKIAPFANPGRGQATRQPAVRPA